MNPETDARTHVILPKDILARIDRLVGQRRRSQFLAEAARREIEHIELLEVARAAAGSARGEAGPWGETPESIASWIADLRDDDRARDDELDAARDRARKHP